MALKAFRAVSIIRLKLLPVTVVGAQGIEPAVPRRFPPTQDVVDKLGFLAGHCSIPSPNILGRAYPIVE
jgi:hypothetical protein